MDRCQVTASREPLSEARAEMAMEGGRRGEERKGEGGREEGGGKERGRGRERG